MSFQVQKKKVVPFSLVSRLSGYTLTVLVLKSKISFGRKKRTICFCDQQSLNCFYWPAKMIQIQSLVRRQKLSDGY